MKATKVSLAFFLILVIAASNEQNFINVSVSKGTAVSIKRVAVLDFECPIGSRVDFNWGYGLYNGEGGKIISNRLMTSLLQLNQYNLIERNEIERILKEQGFSLSDLIDQNKLMVVGKLLPVDGIIIGKVNEYCWWSNSSGFTNGSNISFNARLVSTKTGEIIWSMDGYKTIRQMPPDPVSNLLIDEMVNELTKKLKMSQSTDKNNQ